MGSEARTLEGGRNRRRDIVNNQPLSRSEAARAIAAVGLLAIGLIHLLDLPAKIEETPYMAVLYVGLIGACVAVAGLLLVSASARVWATGAALGALPLVGYVLTRTTGLPGATGDIRHWSEPLGMASLFVEAVVLALCLAAAASAAGERDTHPSAGDPSRKARDSVGA
jgi:hypothetical protein